jgi:hypothetical protein
MQTQNLRKLVGKEEVVSNSSSFDDLLDSFFFFIRGNLPFKMVYNVKCVKNYFSKEMKRISVPFSFVPKRKFDLD